MFKLKTRTVGALLASVALACAFPAFAQNYQIANSTAGSQTAAAPISQALATINNNVSNAYNQATNASNQANNAYNTAINIANNTTGRVVGTYAFRQAIDYGCTGSGADTQCTPSQVSTIGGQCVSGWRYVPPQEGIFFYGGYNNTMSVSKLWDCPGGSGNSDPAH